MLSSATSVTMGILENYFKQIIADYYRGVEGNGEASVDILLENWELASVLSLEVCLWELQWEELQPQLSHRDLEFRSNKSGNCCVTRETGFVWTNKNDVLMISLWSLRGFLGTHLLKKPESCCISLV